MAEPVLTLQQVADDLGVHYMTAYRYVRLGLLEATKVGGGWQITESALADFRASREPGRPQRLQAAPWSDRLESRLIAGDAAGAWGVIEACLSGGMEIVDVYLSVLSPALRSIGERWATGQIDIAIEHRASGVASRLIGRLGSHCNRRGRSRGTIVLGAPAGERHGLVVAILADLLRLEGWEVADLGADTPTASFLSVVAITDDLVAVGLSVTNPDNLDALTETCAALRAAGVGVPIIAGGQAVTGTDHALALGADGAATSVAGVAALLAAGGGASAQQG